MITFWGLSSRGEGFDKPHAVLDCDQSNGPMSPKVHI